MQLDTSQSSMFVLFVGEQTQGDISLKNSLVEQGLNWTIARVASAEAALSAPSDGPVDVLVVDARLNGGDGSKLLARYRTEHPETVRILLLDEKAEPPDTTSMEVAQRLLSHPLRAEELVETIDGVLELRTLLDAPALKTFVGRFAQLPAAPELYLELTRVLNDPDCTTSHLINLVSRDPATAARVLRMCNSAYFSGGRVVSDLRSAVIRLGGQNLRRLVLASEVFSDNSPAAAVDREAMQQRAIRSSELALALLGDASADLAATACLLAEVGKLLPGVDTTEPGDATSPASDAPGYAETGAYLLGLWGLPLPIVEAVANQHRPSRSGHRGFWVTGAVHVARSLTCGLPVDEAYLASVAMAQRLPEWTKLVVSEEVA
ncbi:MAG: HDOD domain-containing protein [Xanthomonadaceae bacterium]|nr:HDOD domain-containing protein [Xanthomonadaceae bacterium]